MAPPLRATPRVIDMFSRATLLVAAFAVAVKAHPCETEHFEFCPEHGPDTLGKCLGPLENKSVDCANWVAVHEACLGVLKAECGTRCGGEPCHYRDDAMACLTEWTSVDKITPECAAALPERKVVKEDEESAERKARRKKRKSRRKRGGEEVKKYHANEEKEKKAAKKKARKKKKKNKKKKKKQTDL
jgi:hypothetical protein